jgi:hypothetical protein
MIVEDPIVVPDGLKKVVIPDDFDMNAMPRVIPMCPNMNMV